MSEEEVTPRTQLGNIAGGFSVGQQAAVATAGAVLTGALFAIVGIVLHLSRGQVTVVVAALGLLVLVGVVYALFRAMMLSAVEEEGDPIAALTYPLFPVLFLVLALAVGLFIGVYVSHS